jgi:3-dehydroquinate dehydratase I
MPDLAPGPLLVAVADRSESLAAAAAMAPHTRPFDLLEARVDLFADQRMDAGTAACRALETSGTPVLVTIRAASQGGRFTAGEPARLERFRAALAVASWADVEDDAAIIAEVAALVRARPTGQLVVSHHDFAATPPLAELRTIIEACHAAMPGAIAKLATRVNQQDDAASLHALLAEHPTRTAVIGMGGSDGELRVQLAAAGSRLAYGFLADSTAPGQISAAALHARLLAASTTYAARWRVRQASAASI